MSQAKYKKEKATKHMPMSRLVREGILIFSIAVAIFLILALISYHSTDPGWSRTGNVLVSVSGSGKVVANLGGYVGAWIADVLLCAFGCVAYLFPLLLVYGALLLFKKNRHNEFQQIIFILHSFGFTLILLAGSSLADIYFGFVNMPFGSGGVLGNLFAAGMRNIFNLLGAKIILMALFLVGITLFSGLSWFKTIDLLGRGVMIMIDFVGSMMFKPKEGSGKTSAMMVKLKYSPHLAEGMDFSDNIDSQRSADKTLTAEAGTAPGCERKAPVISLPKPIKTSLRSEREKQIDLFEPELEGSFPPLSLLEMPDKSSRNNYTKQQLEEMSRLVELRLQDFAVETQVVAVHPGPVVTRFELQLAAGTKASRITSLAKDLARSLSVISVRVVEIIPGKSCIGLELPNEVREVVKLREILSSQQYEQARSPLTIALGKDIAGHPVIVDLAKMPHLLVAGTTGSGKSVCLNAMLLSLLYKYTPKEMRMILIDPKMLELSLYDGIPHLLTPVVTDMKQAANALRWCVAEMEKRYKLMATLGVRNVAGYNHKVREAKSKGAPLLDPLWQEGLSDEPEELQELSYVVVIADEYADMIMAVGKKVEELIARIAQKARAAGIHLVLATQRPSVDVITGLIKANIPTRIAFQVSSKIDSRTILDQSGAEQLLGFGDMLYLPPGSGIPVRVHGAFVSDEEVHKVVRDLKRRGQPEYLDEILEGATAPIPGIDADASEFGDDGELDPLYDQAVKIVTETRRSSISNIQRRLKIGYNRAARIVETMEAAGVVGPMETNGNREVLAPPPSPRDD